MAMFNQAGDHTWEDWEVKMRKEHPVRYFFAETLPFEFRMRIKNPVRDAWYWIKCHLLPSYCYHKLDLRQPKREDGQDYKYGWIDSDTKMLYAMFNILNLFVKDEMPNYYCPSEEEVQKDPNLLRQRHVYLEAKALHYWWNVERPRQNKRYSELLHNWSEAKKSGNPEEHRFWVDLHKFEEAQEVKEDEMVGRLLNIRRSLWT